MRGKVDKRPNDGRATAMVPHSILIVFIITIVLIAIAPVQAGNASNIIISNSSVSTYIVVFNNTMSAMDVQDNAVYSIESYGGSVKYKYNIINGMAATIPDNMISQVESLPNVKYVQKSQEVYALLNQSIPIIGANISWAEGYNGTGVRIAILDTGVDASHPDFYNRIIAWKDYTGDSSGVIHTSPYDDLGHGTHVSSIAAGSGNASGGKFTGVAPNSSLIEAKVLNYQGIGSDTDIIEAIQWAVNNHAQVISMSFGSNSHDSALDSAVDSAIQAGVTVVAAAGNSGPDNGTVWSPGDDPNAITVGAVDKSDNLATWSSRGPAYDGYTKPDVVNIGVSVIAANASGIASPIGTAVSGTNGYYQMLSGTSMATPMTSGVVALMLEKDPSMTPAQVKYILEKTAKPLDNEPIPNNNWGYGSVQANYAVDNSTYSALYLSNTIPGIMYANTTYTVNITMKNDGCYNWSYANNTTLHGIKGALIFGNSAINMDAGANVSPGQQYNWSFTMTAPSTAGIYDPMFQVYANNTSVGSLLNQSVQVISNVSTLQFSSSSYNAYKTSGNATILVNRSDDPYNADSVNYSTGDGSANAYTDYIPANGTLAFAAGQMNATFNVILLNNGAYTGNRTIDLTLSNVTGVTGNAMLGNSMATLTIIDSSPRPVLQFGASNYSALDNQTNITATIVRTANLNGSISVNYSAAGGNATTGIDYIPANGTLNFTDGQSSGTFNITLLGNTTNSTDRTVDLSLSSPTNGSILGTQATAVLIIKGNEAMLNYTFNLTAGWNLISVPLNLTNNSFDSFFPANVKSHVLVAWAYEGSSQGWEYYTPQSGYSPNTLTTVDTQHGYWVKVDQNVSFTINGTAGNATTLNTGWNLVGYPSTTSVDPAVAYPGAFVIWEYKNGNWYFYTPESGYDPNTLTSMDTGYGYWVKVT